MEAVASLPERRNAPADAGIDSAARHGPSWKAATRVLRYFGYGSNMDLASLRAKGVEPRASERATLPGWTLVFDVRHWFRHEGGVANIRRSPEPEACVHGVVHTCDDEQLARLDAVESYGVGYDRIEVELDTAQGPLRATTYVGLPGYLDPACLPTRRYLGIILRGATSAGLPAVYLERLRGQPLHPEASYPPFEHPPGPVPVFDRRRLAAYPRHTAVAGAVFDMEGAQPRLHCLFELFGGKDTTLFHLRRLDTSDGSETLDDVRHGRISAAGRRYLDAYLHEYAAEFRYVGRYSYDELDEPDPDA